MSRIALGTVQFGMKYGISNQSGIVQPDELRSIFGIANKIGIDTLDTAINYQDSEKNIGLNNVKNFKIITKIPSIPNQIDDVNEWFSSQLELSLHRLQVSSIYGLLLHSPDDLLEVNGSAIYRALRSLKDSGKVLKIGISVNIFDNLSRILDLYKFDLIQAPFNLIDRRLIKNGFLDLLKNNNYEVHARSVFLQGLLLMNNLNRPAKFSKWNPLWDEFLKWCSLHSVSPLQSAIRFPLSFSEIDKVVIGIENSHQLLEIFNAAYDERNNETYPDIGCDDLDLINPSRWIDF